MSLVPITQYRMVGNKVVMIWNLSRWKWLWPNLIYCTDIETVKASQSFSVDFQTGNLPNRNQTGLSQLC
jgi:hypothetical protein